MSCTHPPKREVQQQLVPRKRVPPVQTVAQNPSVPCLSLQLFRGWVLPEGKTRGANSQGASCGIRTRPCGIRSNTRGSSKMSGFRSSPRDWHMQMHACLAACRPSKAYLNNSVCSCGLACWDSTGDRGPGTRKTPHPSPDPHLVYRQSRLVLSPNHILTSDSSKKQSLKTDTKQIAHIYEEPCDISVRVYVGQ